MTPAEALVFGLAIGVSAGVLLDHFVLVPLVMWHARVARRDRGR